MTLNKVIIDTQVHEFRLQVPDSRSVRVVEAVRGYVAHMAKLPRKKEGEEELKIHTGTVQAPNGGPMHACVTLDLDGKQYVLLDNEAEAVATIIDETTRDCMAAKTGDDYSIHFDVVMLLRQGLRMSLESLEKFKATKNEQGI